MMGIAPGVSEKTVLVYSLSLPRCPGIQRLHPFLLACRKVFEVSVVSGGKSSRCSVYHTASCVWFALIVVCVLFAPLHILPDTTSCCPHNRGTSGECTAFLFRDFSSVSLSCLLNGTGYLLAPVQSQYGDIYWGTVSASAMEHSSDLQADMFVGRPGTFSTPSLRGWERAFSNFHQKKVFPGKNTCWQASIQLRS